MMSSVMFPQAPFARALFGECRSTRKKKAHVQSKIMPKLHVSSCFMVVANAPEYSLSLSIYLYLAGEMKVSTFTVAALFSKMALTGQRIAMVGLVLFFQHFHIYRRGGWRQSFPLKIFFSCSLGGGGGGRCFSVPCISLYLLDFRYCQGIGAMQLKRFSS